MEGLAQVNLLQPLVDPSTEADSTYNVIEVPTESAQVGDDGKYPIFFIAGPKLKCIRLVRLICFFIILLMYSAFSRNSTTLLNLMVNFLTYKEVSFSSVAHTESHPIDLLPVVLSGLPLVLSVIFGFASDYTHYQRAYMLGYSFVFSSFSAFCLMLCGFLITPDGYTEEPTLLALISASIILYVLGAAIFLPTSLAYGLDLLEGTKWEVKYLYFPVYYVVLNLGNLGGVLHYVYFAYESQLERWCNINFSLMALILILHVIFRLFQIFPPFDKPTEFDVISFRKGIEIFWNSLKVLRAGQKSPRGHWFIQLSSEVYYGKYPRNQVQMVASFFEINFLLFFLFFLFTISEAMSTMFPHQGFFLRFHSNATKAFCVHEPSGTVYNLSYVNFITVIVLTPFIEYYFYKIIFFFNSSENLQGARRNTSIWRNILKCLRCFDRYWHVYDPILKRIFWGSTFSFLAVILAMMVETVRLHTLEHMTCKNHSHHETFMYSTLLIYSQIPQYIFSGILEIVSFIGCLQFVYFQSNNTYKDQLKGLFFGLFYFYFGLATILCDLFHFTFAVISSYYDDICLIYTENCLHETKTLTWIPYGMLFIASTGVMILFAVFAHYRHHQLSNINKRGSFLYDEEG